MRGHVRKRGNTWSVFYDRPRDSMTGERRKTSKSGFGTRKEAERWWADTLAKLNRGDYIESTTKTLGAYLSEWLAGLATRGLRPSTLSSYSMYVEKYVIPRLGAVPVQRLTPAQLTAMYGDLLREGRLHPGRGGASTLSARTVRYVHTIIKKALADAVRQGLVSKNVADLADPPSARLAKADAERARHAWSPEQLAAFLEHVRTHPLAAAFLLLGTTGARRGEVLALRWSDCDLEAGRVSIARTATVIDGEVQFGAPKTRSGMRTIALDPASVTALREHRKRQIEERMALGLGQAELVFCREDGSPLQPSTFSHTFTQLVRSSGLPLIRLHDLRHTWASLALAAGVPAKNVSERLGHSGIQITLDTYTHTTPVQDEQAANAVAALVFGAAHASPAGGRP